MNNRSVDQVGLLRARRQLDEILVNLSGRSQIRVLRWLLKVGLVRKLLRVMNILSILEHKVRTLITVIIYGSSVGLGSISEIGCQLLLFNDLRILFLHRLHLLVSLNALQSTHDAKVVPLENWQLDLVEIFEVLAALVLDWALNIDFYIPQRLICAFYLSRRLRSIQQDLVDFLLHLKMGTMASFLGGTRLDLAVAQIEEFCTLLQYTNHVVLNLLG